MKKQNTIKKKSEWGLFIQNDQKGPSFIQQLIGGRSDPVTAAGLLKILLAKKKNPKVWPATATKSTPTLKDITANITI